MKDIDVLKYINENSDYVTINLEKLYLFVDNVQTYNYHYWLSLDDLKLSEKEFIIFAFICESMNFCFWDKRDWTLEYKDKTYNGSEAMFYTLVKTINLNKDFLNINKLLELSEDDFKKIMTSNGKIPPLLSKRYELFKETVNVISTKGEKFFEEIFSLKTAEELLGYIVKNFHHFDDYSEYKNKIVHFNKRAILLVNDLFNLSKTIRDNIKTLDNLTGGADYAIPRLFQEYGIFAYKGDLLERIVNKKEIPHNSNMEIEIRANTLYAIELILIELKKRQININAIELDNIIWNMRIRGEGKFPIHQTTTIYY